MRYRKISAQVFTFCTIICFLLPVSSALAHKVNLFAYTEGDRLIVESYFADGKPVENGKISVFAGGEKILEGTTGKEGKASFSIPAKTDLTIEVDGSLGHKAAFTLKKEDL